MTFWVSIDGGSNWKQYGGVIAFTGSGVTALGIPYATAISELYTPDHTGQYYFNATYSGDHNYDGSSGCQYAEPLCVKKVLPCVETTLHLVGSEDANAVDSVNYGQTSTTVTVSGPSNVQIPTGTVTFWYSLNGVPWTQLGDTGTTAERNGLV